MSLRHDLKVWWRSGSWAFARAKRPRAELDVLDWRGLPLYYRPGTSDCGCIYEILLRPRRKAEYRLPDGLDPRVILDIGGNIGIAAVFFAHRYPAATVYTFEPVAENFAILLKNVAALKNVRAFPFGLGAEAGSFDLYASEDPRNLGGYSRHARAGDGINAGTDAARTVRCEIRPIAQALAGLGIGTVDLIKIDTEGSEYEILTAMDAGMLSRVQWILGELHGRRDFELLAYLAQWFDLQLDKKMNSELFLFQARNKSWRGRLEPLR